jgi:hypothetical protein
VTARKASTTRRVKARADGSGSCVLFFGAGASKTFGYPLTGEILPRIRERLRSRELFPVASNPKRERAKMARLEDYLTQLMPAFFKHDYLPLITDVLSLIDLLLSTKEVAVPMMSDKQLEDMRTLLEQAIVEAITTGNDDVSTERLEKLSDWILGARGGSPITVVSTNYDTLIEERLFTKMTLYEELGRVADVDLGFSWREHRTGTFLEPVNHTGTSPIVRVFKLHGSVSWLKCPLCGFIYVNTVGSIYGQAFRGDKVDYNNTCLCGHGPVRSVIVAPSMVRSIQEPNLLTIWRSALEAMRTADEWIIAGYSLPSEDIAIRSILLRAYHGRGRRPPPRITVVQQGREDETEGRYVTLLPSCTFTYDGFEQFIDALPEPSRRFPTF